MRKFIQRHLEPAERLGEVLFGLIMALGFTGAIRIGTEAPSNRELLLAILGCNLAWGVVDGVMFAMLSLFERARKAKLVDRVLKAPSDEAAINLIAEALDDWLKPLTSPQECEQVYRWILANARKKEWPTPRLQKEEILGGIAVGLAILLTTLPMLIPFVVIPKPELAVRLSNLIAFTMLFGIGCWWGREAGGNPWRIGLGMMTVGVVLVAITIALGG